MNTTPAKKHSRCRNRDLPSSPAKRKAHRRRGLRAFRCWQHLTRCFSAFHSRKLIAFSMFRILRQAFGSAVLALLLPAIAKANHFIVTTNSDTTDAGDGELTLREAITLANNSAGPDTVGFVGGLSGEVLILTQGELVISDDLGINASSLAQAPIIDANQNSRVIDFTAATGDLELTKLILRNGKATGQTAEGGGIRSSGGDLTITNSTLSGNFADGDDSSIGGGIFTVSGDVTLIGSSLSGNTASGGYVANSGGGIYTTSGAVILTNSTLSGNSASGYYGANGGGIQTSSGDVTLNNSTLSGNSASCHENDAEGGGVQTNSGVVTLNNSTLSGNFADSYDDDAKGGGVQTNSGIVMINNSTLSENFAYSYDGGANGGGIQTISGDVTLTYSTLSENSASTTGNSDVSSGGGIQTSSGAVSLVNSTVSGNSTSATGRFGDAYGGGILTSSGVVSLTHSTLSENFASGDDPKGGGILTDDGDITLINSTLCGNSALGEDAEGGGILTGNGDITLTNSTLSGNSADGSYTAGGGIVSGPGSVTLTDSTLNGNSASGSYAYGGGILSASGAVTLTRSTLSGNSARGSRSGKAGGIGALYGSTTLTDSTLSGNSASATFGTAWAGGIRSSGGNLAITNSTLSGNSASGGYSGRGGGIFASGTLTAVNSTLSENSTSGDDGGGGGISSIGNLSLTLTNSIVAGNSDQGTAPDVLAPIDPANDLEVSHCLIGDSSGARLDEAAVNLNNITDVDPLLTPLADNGGDTKTQLPFPGSPAINAGGGSPPLQDQRGFDRVGLPDIGAVEYQGSSDWVRIFESDHDGDGNSYGIEQALGTNPNVSDPGNPLNLTTPTFNSSGQPMLSFGIASNAAPGTRWVLERSINLAAFQEIYLFDGTTHFDFVGIPIDIQTTASGVTITDEDPPTGDAFYRFKTSMPEPN